MKIDAIEPGVVYHLFNRGNNKEDIFKEERNYHHFLSLMEKHLLTVADIYCYCLLKNHFHLLLRIKDAELIPEKFRPKPFLPFSHFFNAYAKSINKAYNRTGSLFQEHPHRKRVCDENYLTQLVAYIHLNPEKHRFTKNFREYPYSSYQVFRSNVKSNIDTEYIMKYFGTHQNFEFWHNLNRIKYEGIVEEIDNLDVI